MEEEWGAGGLGGVKVTAWRLQLCHSIKEGCGFFQRGSVGGSVLHVCSNTQLYTDCVQLHLDRPSHSLTLAASPPSGHLMNLTDLISL